MLVILEIQFKAQWFQFCMSSFGVKKSCEAKKGGKNCGRISVVRRDLRRQSDNLSYLKSKEMHYAHTGKRKNRRTKSQTQYPHTQQPKFDVIGPTQIARPAPSRNLRWSDIWFFWFPWWRECCKLRYHRPIACGNRRCWECKQAAGGLELENNRGAECRKL